MDAADFEKWAMRVKHFQKPAHVGPFEVVGEVHSELDGGDRLAGLSVFALDPHGVAEVFDAHAVNGNATGIGLVLGVDEAHCV
jgi:hypothetical protein